jgi:hypothetical protein
VLFAALLVVGLLARTGRLPRACFRTDRRAAFWRFIVGELNYCLICIFKD